MVKKMEMKICKKCKVTNPNEAKFCRGCGVNLDASGDLGIWKVVLSIVAVIILGICVYAISESSSSDYTYTAPAATVRPSSSAAETAANDGYDNTDTYDDTDVGITTDDSSESDDTSSSSFTSESSPSIYRMVEVNGLTLVI